MGELNAPPGDLYVEMRVEPDERFERRGEELWHSVRLGIAEAALGKELKVPLVDGGSHLLEIPAGTQPSSLFRISREGMPRLQRRGRGDLVVEVTVHVPERLTGEEEDLFAELRGPSVTRTPARPESAGAAEVADRGADPARLPYRVPGRGRWCV